MSEAKTACVTGACGFIGSHLVRGLLGRGWAVRAFDNLSLGTVERLPASAHLQFVRGDVRDEVAVREAVRGCDVVFHFAAPTDVRTETLRVFTEPEFRKIIGALK